MQQEDNIIKNNRINRNIRTYTDRVYLYIIYYVAELLYLINKLCLENHRIQHEKHCIIAAGRWHYVYIPLGVFELYLYPLDIDILFLHLKRVYIPNSSTNLHIIIIIIIILVLYMFMY